LELEKRDGKRWNVIERAVNGYTAKDLLKLIQTDNVPDCMQACVLIGTNDCKGQTNPDVFANYIHRIDTALRVKGIFPIFGQIPPIYLFGGDYPYQRIHKSFRTMLNQELQRWHPVELELLPECYEDAVHFNDKGNQKVAKLFAEAICSA
jgi:lysophospholipase L1-like esterase